MNPESTKIQRLLIRRPQPQWWDRGRGFASFNLVVVNVRSYQINCFYFFLLDRFYCLFRQMLLVFLVKILLPSVRLQYYTNVKCSKTLLGILIFSSSTRYCGRLRKNKNLSRSKISHPQISSNLYLAGQLFKSKATLEL